MGAGLHGGELLADTNLIAMAFNDDGTVTLKWI